MEADLPRGLAPAGAHPFRRRGRSGHRTPGSHPPPACWPRSRGRYVRQKRSKLAPTSCQASSMIAAGTTAADVVGFFMALLSFRWIQHPEPAGSRRATPTSHFQQRSGHPRIAENGDSPIAYRNSREAPMQTECSPTLFEFEPVERHKVVAGFDGGIITSEMPEGCCWGGWIAASGFIRRMASCFTDRRDPRLLRAHGRDPGRPARVRPRARL